MAYKPNIDDACPPHLWPTFGRRARESPALEIIDIVAKKGGEVSYYDPYIPKVTTSSGRKFKSIDDTQSFPPKRINNPAILQSFDPSVSHSISLSLLSADCVVITTNHSVFDAEMIQRNAKLIVDLRNVIKDDSGTIYKL